MEMDSGEDSETLENGDARAGDMSPVEERNLYGNLHVSGVRVLDLVGSPGTWFFFTDLYVRQEGRYSIRFRCFDTSAVTGSNRVVPHLAECRSQPFSIYPPRQMPSLPKPTELAEHFANQGFKLNSRKNEKTATSSPPPYFHSTAARGETNRPIKQMTGNEPSRPEPNPVQRDITHDGSSSAAASRSGSTVLTASSASMADGS
ncbi:hypothetical protein L202_06029 [Cryptococcus amylolentus CBS 6039]|uniref:Velvet domain-containing protein n=1 Tax=Cryptococcus amylolentus CBS 6039 TaxID=1295533 RepID=A0A1E3HIB1_9TREE|nr:hypothetical protein L202_06029 [Cryptococcus amylolentus CBS 6039]ODN76092.1 hypothetical protein L202_06029 [Cryptococcus amylolentus CBS 6039]